MRRKFLRALSIAAVIVVATEPVSPSVAATLSAQDFIAAAGFPTEHSDAIQTGIDDSNAGDTIYFPPGFYHLTSPLRLKSQQTYRGSKSAILKPTALRARPVLQLEGTTSVTISGLTFQGGGIHLSGQNVSTRIEDNTFQDIFDPAAAFGDEAAIFVAGPLSFAKIKSNTFLRIGLKNGRPGAKNAAALLAYHLENALIADNRFRDVYQAVSLIFEGRTGSGSGLVVTGNLIENAIRMGIEAQGHGVRGARFEANTVTMHATGDEDIGLSIVITGGFDTVVSANKVTRTGTPAGPCAGMGIEAAGTNTAVTNNDIRGPWCSAIGISAKGNQFSRVSQNIICGHTAPYDMISFYNGRGASTSEKNLSYKTCN